MEWAHAHIPFTVDKDELIKALQYDRNQYDKGFVNGYNKGVSEVAREIIELIKNEPAECLPYMTYLFGISLIEKIEDKYMKARERDE